MATLLKLTSYSIASALKPFKIEELFICGGGAKNKALLESISQEFQNQIYVVFKIQLFITFLLLILGHN